MKFLVLAGGFGSRLKTAVTDVPKALAPVGGMPFLQLQIEHWVAQGLNEFTFLLHHRADQIVDFLNKFQKESLKKFKFDFLIEQSPRDTGGAIANAVKEMNLKDDFLVTNADTWLGGGILEVMRSAAPSMAVVNLREVSRYGQVQFNESNFGTAFVEKPSKNDCGWVNAGVYLLHSKLFRDWDGQPFSLERDMLPQLILANHLMVVPLRADFIDIGVPFDYYRFCRWVEGGRQIPL